MEMELKPGAIGPELALSLGDHRFGKGTGLAHRNAAPPARAVTNGRQQDGVTKRRAARRRIDGKYVTPPRQPGPRAKSGGKRHAGQRSQRRAPGPDLPVACRGDPHSRRRFGDAACPIECRNPILVCQRHCLNPNYYQNVNRTNQDSSQAERSVSASLFAPSATTAASDGSFSIASALRRSQAVSIVDCRRLLNAARSSPGAMTGRYSITATPGRRKKPWRRQNRPV